MTPNLAVDQLTRRALGSEAILTLIGGPSAVRLELMKQLWSSVAAFEARFSRFRPTSELSQLNLETSRPRPVSPEMFGVLATAREWALRTGGLYNPFVLPALQMAGYRQSMLPEAHPTPLADVSTRRVADPVELKLSDSSDSHVTLPADSALDLGGIGKGIMLDQLAALAEPHLAAGRLAGYCFSLGGDITAAGIDPSAQPWSVDIEPALPGANTINLAPVTADQSGRLNVATSGTNRRHGVYAGRHWHHLIDPRTGRPAQTNVVTATITATTATAADILASCTVILGSVAAQPFLRTYRRGESRVSRAVLQIAAAAQPIATEAHPAVAENLPAAAIIQEVSL